MNFRFKLSPILTLVLLGVILGGLYLFWQKKDMLRLSWQDTTRRKSLLYNGQLISLFDDRRLEQTFVANYPGLAGINILFQENAQARRVNLHLKQTCQTAKNIAFTSLTLSPSSEPIFYPFTFSPLDDSAGQTYCLVVEAPDLTLENAVTLRLSPGDLYPYGQATIHNPENEATPVASADQSSQDLPYKIYLPIVQHNTPEIIKLVNDIGFRLRYRGRLGPTAQVFIGRLTANKPYPLDQAWFYAGLTLCYVILLAALMLVVRRTIRVDRE